MDSSPATALTSNRSAAATGPQADPSSCSALSSAAGEQLAGSAPSAVAWVALEQSGPWGAKAFTASHLDPAVGKEIEARASAYGVRPGLIRRPGRHADDHRDGRRRLLVGYAVPGRTWLAEGFVEAAEELVDLDWAALQAGHLAGVPGLERTDRPHLLVCTNGTRDVCCASLGRPVATEAHASYPEQVWEVTHTSGHRFAPTAVLLPHGTLHGRLTGAGAVALLDEAHRGRTVLAGSRGRSTWPAEGQVAELAVRDLTGELALDALTVEPAVDGWTVTHTDGRAWQVRTECRDAGVQRPESCGKALAPLAHVATRIRPLTG